MEWIHAGYVLPCFQEDLETKITMLKSLEISSEEKMWTELIVSTLWVSINLPGRILV